MTLTSRKRFTGVKQDIEEKHLNSYNNNSYNIKITLFAAAMKVMAMIEKRNREWSNKQ